MSEERLEVLQGGFGPEPVPRSDGERMRKFAGAFAFEARHFRRMKGADLKEMVEREPFRPFTVRLNYGAQSTFKSPRFLGASQDYGMIFYFADPLGAVRIDRERIVELIEAE